MSDVSEKLVRWVRLRENHVPTGRTSHKVDGQTVETASELRVMPFSADQGFYLMHFNADGDELTDTYHESLDEALEQANFEFGVTPDEWSSDQTARSGGTNNVTEADD